jgi:hypothetical protein
LNTPRTWISLLVLCAVAYLVTAPGRITFPDDEIVFQTTEALWERGELSISGIPKRTGERKGRPNGTFGWETGTDQKRYGIFGHGLSVAALPMYGLGKLAAEYLPESWAHAPRRDLFVFHERSHLADSTRLVVSLTNCVITLMAVWLLMSWVRTLGFSARSTLVTGIAYAFGTSAWPYTSTFLSEPASALCLLGAALLVARWHVGRDARLLWAAGAVAGLSVHVHLLNLLALPCLLGYALAPLLREGSLQRERGAWLGALVLGVLGVGLLGLSHYARFGSPFETGRYANYGEFIWPWEGLAAQVIGPGRSFFLYSPAILLGLFGWRKLRRDVPDAAWFIVAIVILRWVFVSLRSDWYGGWGIGPRYLVAVIPFALLPMAACVDEIVGRPGSKRRAWILGLVGCVLLEGWLAAHSIFEWMWALMMEHGTPDYFAVSHWSPAGSALFGFFDLESRAVSELLSGRWEAAVAAAHFDMIGFGALRLAVAGHRSLLFVVCGLVLIGLVAGARLLRARELRSHG